MVHAQVSDECIHFSLMYNNHHIFTVLPIKHLINQYVDPTTPHKLVTGAKSLVPNLRIMFFTCVV